MKRRSSGLAGALLVSALGCGALENLGDPPQIAPPDVSLVTTASALTIAPGDSLAIPLSVVARASAPDVTVVVSGLPREVTADPLVVPAGAATATLTLRATKTAPAFHGAITVQGLGESTSIALDVRGRSGTLDASFGVDGVVTIRVGDEMAAFGPGWEFPTPRLAAIAVQADGRILYAGHGYRASSTITDSWPMILGRLDDAGAPDPSFNPSGLVPGMIVQVPIGDANFVPSGQGCVRVLPSGAIAIGGYLSVPGDPPAMFVAELTPSGELEAGFGDKGIAPLWGNHLRTYPGGLIVEPDGSFVIGGELGASGPALVRVRAEGRADNTFPAIPNSAYPGFDALAAYPSTTFGPIAQLPNGDILGALVPETASQSVPLAVAIKASNGALDTAFGASGTLAAGSFVGPAVGLTATGDGGALFVGSNAQTIELAHFVDGRLDPHFGAGGIAAPLIHGGKASAGSVLVDGNGAIVVGATLPGAAWIGVVRYTAAGAFDTSFNGTGWNGVAALADAVPGSTTQVAIDAFGRVLAGTLFASSGASNGGDPVIRIARFWP